MKRHIDVALYIDGYEGNPDLFFHDFNLDFDKTVKKEVVNPGHKNISKFSYTKIYSTLEETEELESHIQSLIDRIKNREQFKSEINSSKFQAGIDVVIRIAKGEMSPKCAMCLSSAMLKNISDLNLEMDFDIYS